MMKNTMKMVMGFASLFAATGFAQTVIDFNNTGDLAADFAGYASGTQFVNVATGGLSNSGFVSMDPSASDNYAVYQTGMDATAFSGAIAGGYFLYDGTTFASRPLSFGFTSSATDTYSGSTTTTGTDIKMNLLGANSGTNVGIEIYNNGTAVDTSATNVTLTAGNWYYMQLNIGGVSGGDFTGVSAQLYASDSSGVLGSVLKDLNNSGSNYTVTSSLTADTSVYGFFGGIGPGSRGIDGVDNFTVAIPEPSTFVLVGIALGAVMLFRRKK